MVTGDCLLRGTLNQRSSASVHMKCHLRRVAGQWDAAAMVLKILGWWNYDEPRYTASRKRPSMISL